MAAKAESAVEDRTLCFHAMRTANRYIFPPSILQHGDIGRRVRAPSRAKHHPVRDLCGAAECRFGRGVLDQGRAAALAVGWQIATGYPHGTAIPPVLLPSG